MKRKYVKKEKVIEITPVAFSDFNKDLFFLTKSKFTEKEKSTKSNQQ